MTYIDFIFMVLGVVFKKRQFILIFSRVANVVTCDEEDGHISYHPDKANCAMYYMCEGERKHHMPCPVQLVFNPSQNGKLLQPFLKFLFHR